jgi:hypothetical protein
LVAALPPRLGEERIQPLTSCASEQLTNAAGREVERPLALRTGVAPRITSDTPSGPMNLINAVVAATAFSIVDGIGKVRLSSP